MLYYFKQYQTSVFIDLYTNIDGDVHPFILVYPRTLEYKIVYSYGSIHVI